MNFYTLMPSKNPLLVKEFMSNKQEPSFEEQKMAECPKLPHVERLGLTISVDGHHVFNPGQTRVNQWVDAYELEAKLAEKDKIMETLIVKFAIATLTPQLLADYRAALKSGAKDE